MAESTGNTGTRDVTYDLVSIIFHALQSAETIDRYIRDAEQSGDTDVRQFFTEVKQENIRTADRGKQLLARQIGQQGQAAGR